MERQEFLKSLGISFVVVCAGSCLASCGKDEPAKIDDAVTPPPVEEPPLPAGTVTAKFTDMPKVGNSIIVGKVLFIRLAAENIASSFVAIFKFCPHQGGDLYWNNTSIECGKHGARYDISGAIRNQPRTGGGSTSPLKPYPLTVTATNVNANTA